MQIPNRFLEIASQYGLVGWMAEQVFYLKKNKKGCYHLCEKLVEEGKAASTKQANKMILKAWREYTRSGYTNDTAGTVDTYSTFDNETYVEIARRNLDSIIGPTNYAYSQARGKNVLHRVVIAGDFHVPYTAPESIRRLLADPADTLVIAGDFFDMYAASRFRKHIDHITVATELAEGQALLEKLAEKFSTIYYITGNHDLNARKRVEEIYPQLSPLIVDPMALLTRDLPNVKKLTVPVKGVNPKNLGHLKDFELEFVGTLGDVVIGHFENFSGADAYFQADRYLNEWEHILKLNPRVITQAHNHRLGATYTPNGRLLIHTGCMCRPMEYQFINHGKYQPPTLGYVALYIKNGVCDQTKMELIHVQEEL